MCQQGLVEGRVGDAETSTESPGVWSGKLPKLACMMKRKAGTQPDIGLMYHGL
jgi:hypothetical protein